MLTDVESSLLRNAFPFLSKLENFEEYMVHQSSETYCCVVIQLVSFQVKKIYYPTDVRDYLGTKTCEFSPATTE